MYPFSSLSVSFTSNGSMVYADGVLVAGFPDVADLVRLPLEDMLALVFDVVAAMIRDHAH